jgi:hypothetical protein
VTRRRQSVEWKWNISSKTAVEARRRYFARVPRGQRFDERRARSRAPGTRGGVPRPASPSDSTPRSVPAARPRRDRVVVRARDVACAPTRASIRGGDDARKVADAEEKRTSRADAETRAVTVAGASRASTASSGAFGASSRSFFALEFRVDRLDAAGSEPRWRVARAVDSDAVDDFPAGALAAARRDVVAGIARLRSVARVDRSLRVARRAFRRVKARATSRRRALRV